MTLFSIYTIIGLVLCTLWIVTSSEVRQIIYTTEKPLLIALEVLIFCGIIMTWPLVWLVRVINIFRSIFNQEEP